MSTRIEWADETWSPIVGCTKRTEGCRNCWAIRECHRMGRNPQATMRANYGGLVTPDGKNWTGVIRLLTGKLDLPARWQQHKRVFVCPVSDLFHPVARIAWVLEVFSAMSWSKQHTYLVVTKRWKRMQHLLAYGERLVCDPKEPAEHHQLLMTMPQRHIWLGCSVHDQASFDEAWKYLRETPAGLRFISYEPALGPLVLPAEALAREPRLEWVICGGESGTGARPMRLEWARGVRDQCIGAGVPFFFKQWGAWLPAGPGWGFAELLNRPRESRCVIHSGEWNWFERVGKKIAGRELDGRMWDEIPETA